MASPSDAIASKVRDSFKELAKTSSHLNSVSDALGKYIAEIEKALKTLKLGVASWVVVERSSQDDGLVVTTRSLGYDRIGKNWCIALRSCTDADWAEEPLEYESWIFNEGPRWLRIKAIDHLPALIEKLNADAANIAKHVKDKLPTAYEVANEVSAIVEAKEAEGQKR